MPSEANESAVGGEAGQQLPVCPVRGSVIYPTMVQHIDAGRASSIRAIEAALAGSKTLLIVSQRDKEVEAPQPADLYQVGTACNVLRVRKNADGSVQILVSALTRQRVLRYLGEDPLFAETAELPSDSGDGEELEALSRLLRRRVTEVIGGGQLLPAEVVQLIGNLEDPGQLADAVAFHMDFKLADKQAVLEASSVPERIRIVLALLDREAELLEVQRQIQQQVRERIDRHQRDFYLREQLRAIQRELGSADAEESEVEEFRRKIEALELQGEAKREAERELGRLAKMGQDSAEATVIRTYLSWLTELPWNRRSEDHLDLGEAERILERDHYGLHRVKDRILEFLAVRRLKQLRVEQGDLLPEELHRGPILAFTGPPGVGKTSIAQAIAQAMGRRYVRVGLGGVRDESDIRGHRRTYIGAMPGRIVQGIRTAGTKNPVFLLDEVDKLGRSQQGDPASALLEVLDPAQNHSFGDHYLGVPFDLSEVMFIATANYQEQIPEPLLDRMEIIEFPSYIEQVKQEIARRYLWPRQVLANGLKPNQAALSDAALEGLITGYTREAGVRSLERELGALARKVARRIASGELKRAKIAERDLTRYLGPPRFSKELEAAEDAVGVATGMFYTPVGGDILFVETTVMPGKGLVLTGQLGEVMRESARAALSFAKANSWRLQLDSERIEASEIHIHVPAGAVPKEGPSAGVTMACSLISALSGIPVHRDVAMTGEITLTGRVLPIGGLREKVLGARRAGIRRVLLPAQNLKDLEEIPAALRQGMEFHPCATLDEVLGVALVGGFPGSAGLSKRATA